MSDSDRTMRVASAGAIDMLLTLAEAGIPCPPLAGLAPQIETLGAWHWGTRYCDPLLLYMFRVDPVLGWTTSGEPTFLLNHFGHGTNSYALTLFVTAGPVAAFVQHGFGGVYTEPVFAREQIASTYARLSILLSRGQLPPGPARWLLLYSQIREVAGLIDLHHYTPGQQWREAVESSEDQTALFQLTAAKFPDADFGFPAAVEW